MQQYDHSIGHWNRTMGQNWSFLITNRLFWATWIHKLNAWSTMHLSCSYGLSHRSFKCDSFDCTNSMEAQTCWQIIRWSVWIQIKINWLSRRPHFSVEWKLHPECWLSELGSRLHWNRVGAIKVKNLVREYW